MSFLLLFWRLWLLFKIFINHIFEVEYLSWSFTLLALSFWAISGEVVLLWTHRWGLFGVFLFKVLTTIKANIQMRYVLVTKINCLILIKSFFGRIKESYFLLSNLLIDLWNLWRWRYMLDDREHLLGWEWLLDSSFSKLWLLRFGRGRPWRCPLSRHHIAVSCYLLLFFERSLFLLRVAFGRILDLLSIFTLTEFTI